jgi:alpha-ribazole phosphatase
MIRLFLVPHAETAWNASGRYQGQTDVPLSERGRQQALQLANRLASRTLDIVYASDLSRARETAVAIAQPHGLLVRTDPRLRELNFGAWEGLTYPQIQQQDPQSLGAWEAEGESESPPGGENLMDLARRVRSFLDDIEKHAGGSNRTGVVVAHRGSLRVLLCLVLGLRPSAHWQFRLDIASLSELAQGHKGAVLLRLNDTHHLHETGHAG